MFLVCRYPGIVLPVGVALQRDPHMFEHEVSDSDRRSRLSHTANYWCRRIQPVRSGCLSQRKKSVESVGIRAGDRQCSGYLQIVVASPRSYLSSTSAQRQTLRRGTIRPVLTSSHYTRLRRVFTALQDQSANFPSLCCLFQQHCCGLASLVERCEMFHSESRLAMFRGSARR